MTPTLIIGKSIAEWRQPPNTISLTPDPVEAHSGAFLHTPAVRDGSGALFLAWCFVQGNVIDATVTKYVNGVQTGQWQIHPREGAYKFDSFSLCVGSDTDPTALVCVGGYHAAISDPNRLTGVARADIAGICSPARNLLPALPAINPVPIFNDVPPADPFFGPIQQAASAGLISGYSNPDGTVSFRSGAPVTRGQLAKIMIALWRALLGG